MNLVRRADGTVHISDLKAFGLSPAHYRATVEGRRAPKARRPLAIGTIAHVISLGQRARQRLVRYPGAARRGGAWTEFEAAHLGADIVTAAEWDAGAAIADAIIMHPIAGPMIRDARREVPLRWDDGGITCATDGIDLLGEWWIGELKTSTTAHPARFQALAMNMAYHAQLAWYRRGVEVVHDRPSKCRIIVAEVTPPYVVTVLDVSDAVVDEGQKLCSLWLERLRVCEENDTWPGYAETMLPFDLPPWMVGEPEDVPDEDQPGPIDLADALGGAA